MWNAKNNLENTTVLNLYQKSYAHGQNRGATQELLSELRLKCCALQSSQRFWVVQAGGSGWAASASRPLRHDPKSTFQWTSSCPTKTMALPATSPAHRTAGPSAEAATPSARAKARPRTEFSCLSVRLAARQTHDRSRNARHLRTCTVLFPLKSEFSKFCAI